MPFFSRIFRVHSNIHIKVPIFGLLHVHSNIHVSLYMFFTCMLEYTYSCVRVVWMCYYKHNINITLSILHYTLPLQPLYSNTYIRVLEVSKLVNLSYRQFSLNFASILFMAKIIQKQVARIRFLKIYSTFCQKR